MHYTKLNRSSPNIFIKIIIVILVFTSALLFVLLNYSNLTLLQLIRFDYGFQPVNQSLVRLLVQKYPFHAYNQTHLWTLRLADENFRQLARLIPCRVVTYDGGPHHKITEKIDTCPWSNQNEFFNDNTVFAQKWIYDHQHPANCSNKRFAIIRRLASSGYGSIIHQVVWAFGMALAQDRIAVYETPGNWVSNLIIFVSYIHFYQFYSDVCQLSNNDSRLCISSDNQLFCSIGCRW